MKPRIAILAALPREIAPLVKGWPVHAASRDEAWKIAECDQAIAVCAGMGRERVTRALQLAEVRGPLCRLISVGYAGALRSTIKRNTLYWPATVIDASTEKRYSCEAGNGTLVTSDHVVHAQEKMQMAVRWNADLVDMEASTVAQLAEMRGLPFRTLRVVSDEAEEHLPDIHRFTNANGGFREAAFAGYLALHPWLLPAVIRLGRHSGQASHIMAQALREFLARVE